MTVHVISVGLSLLDALADPSALADQRGKLAGKPGLVAAIERATPRDLLATAGIGERARDSEAASEWLIAALTEGNSGPNRALAEATATARCGEWPMELSAELETFARVQDTGGFSLNAGDDGDIALLVCSDTPVGLLAGLWNALALTGGDLSRVRYVPEAPRPGKPLDDLRGHAVLVRVTGMDVGNSHGFKRAMGGLCLLARQVFASSTLRKEKTGPEEFRFHLSGGFKAAVPYLIGLAEAVRSVDRACLEPLGAGHLAPASGIYPARAFMLHEAAGPGTPPIELPLRRLVARVVRNELTDFKDGKHVGGLPGNAVLYGYAYEVTGGKAGQETCELTPFGTGLRELFGLAREGYGG